MNKILFMPYDPNNNSIVVTRMEYGDKGPEIMRKNFKVIEHELSLGHAPIAVWYNGRKQPFVQSFTTGQIYIRGHGMPGFISIEGGRGGERVHYEDVAKRLISSGLPKSYQGDIKCFICHSAESGKPGTDPEITDGQPFAKSLADYLYSKGYKACRYFGYLGSVDSFAKEGSAGKEYYVRTIENGKQVELGKASQACIEFHPTIEMRSFWQRIAGWR
ncbi:MAG TPA: hypothetical protein ENK06_06360 [Gammaproteobacteria bacterium]|nr:hypothetical protein [Gammaproteobacteria bacterium]